MPGKTKINIPYTNTNNRLLDEGDIINFAKLDADNHFTGTLTFDTKPGESPQTSYTIQDLYTDVLFNDVAVNSLSDELARHLDENNAQHFTSEDRAVFSQLGVGVLGTGYHNTLKIQAAMPQAENVQTFISLNGDGPGSKITCSSWYFGMDDGTILCATDGPTSTNWGQLLRHVTDSDIHITSDDKTKWNNMADQIAAAQPMLTFDLAPVNASANPVFSGGIYTAIRDALWGDIKFSQTTHADSNAVCNEIILDKSLIPVGELKLMSFANRNGGAPALTGSYACIGELEEDGSLVKLGVSQNTIDQTVASGFSILDFEGSGIYLSGQKPVYICFCHTGSDWGEGGAKTDWSTKDRVGVRTKNRTATDTVTSVKLDGASYPWCAEIGIACLRQHEITVDTLSAPLTIGNLTIDDIGAGTSFTSTGDIVISAPENTTIQNLTIGVSNEHEGGTTIKPAVPDTALSVSGFCSIYVSGPIVDIIGEEEAALRTKDYDRAYVKVNNYSHSSDTYSGDAGVYIGTSNWVASSINLHGHYDENGYSDIFKLQSVFVEGPYIDVKTNRVKYTPNISEYNTVELTFSGSEPSAPNGLFKITAPTGSVEMSGVTTNLASYGFTMNSSTGYREFGGTVLHNTTMVKASLFMSPDDDLAFPHYKITMTGGVDRGTFMDTRYTNIYAGAVYEEFSGLYHKDEIQTVFNTPVTTFGWDHNPGYPSTIDTYFGASFSPGVHSYIDPSLPTTALTWLGSRSLPTLIRGSEINFYGAEGVQFSYLAHNSLIADNSGSNNLVSAKQVYEFVSAYAEGPTTNIPYKFTADGLENITAGYVYGPRMYKEEVNSYYPLNAVYNINGLNYRPDRSGTFNTFSARLLRNGNVLETYAGNGKNKKSGHLATAIALAINDTSTRISAKTVDESTIAVTVLDDSVNYVLEIDTPNGAKSTNLFTDSPLSGTEYTIGPSIALSGMAFSQSGAQGDEEGLRRSLSLITGDKIYIGQHSPDYAAVGEMSISFDNSNCRVELRPYEQFGVTGLVSPGIDIMGGLNVNGGRLSVNGQDVPRFYNTCKAVTLDQTWVWYNGSAIVLSETYDESGTLSSNAFHSQGEPLEIDPGRTKYYTLEISATPGTTTEIAIKSNCDGSKDLTGRPQAGIAYLSYTNNTSGSQPVTVKAYDPNAHIYWADNVQPGSDANTRYIIEMHTVGADIFAKVTKFAIS